MPSDAGQAVLVRGEGEGWVRGGGESRKSRSFKGLRSAKGGKRDPRSLRNTRLKVLTKKPNSHVPGRRMECTRHPRCCVAPLLMLWMIFFARG